jgi:hypothetical protein
MKKTGEKTGDLIYDLSLVPNWMYCPYEPGGLYDQVINNVKENQDIPLLLEQDEYDWFRQPIHSFNYEISTYVNLIKSSDYNGYSSYNIPKEALLTLQLAYYKSAAHNIFATTWVSNSFSIKPFKILNHEWGDGKGIKNYTRDYLKSYACKKCGVNGFEAQYMSNNKKVSSAILPVEFLTCEQRIIQDIIV